MPQIDAELSRTVLQVLLEECNYYYSMGIISDTSNPVENESSNIIFSEKVDDEDIRDRLWMAPMVRGSDLAFRNLVRRSGRIATPCFSPMIRAEQVIKAWEYYHHYYYWTLKASSRDIIDILPQDLPPMHEDAILVLTDVMQDKSDPLVIQLCGCQPDILYRACRILLGFNHEHGCQIVGLDLNLGCPQVCADVGNFGAFLAEGQPEVALKCVAAMRRAIDDDHSENRSRSTNTFDKPRLFCKIRLRDSTEDTIQFARSLQEYGCEVLTVHCRRRQDKHDGIPDYETGRQLVQTFQPKLPILINGNIQCLHDAQKVLQQTRASGVMIARGFLNNPLLLVNTTTTTKVFSPPSPLSVLSMANLYLDHVERHPPPSSLYIRKHFQWLFRAHVRPKTTSQFDGFDDDDWKSKLWTFLQRPYLETIVQFRCILGLYARYMQLEGEMADIPKSLYNYRGVTFRDIRYGRITSQIQVREEEEDDGEVMGVGFFD